MKHIHLIWIAALLLVTAVACSDGSSHDKGDSGNGPEARGGKDKDLSEREKYARDVCELLLQCCDNANYERRSLESCLIFPLRVIDSSIGFNPKYAEQCLKEIKKELMSEKGCGFYAWDTSRSCRLSWRKTDKELSSGGFERRPDLGENCKDTSACRDYDDDLGICVAFGPKGDSNYRCAKWKVGEVGAQPCVVEAPDSFVKSAYWMTHGAATEFVYLCNSKTSFCNVNTFQCEAKNLVGKGESCDGITKSDEVYNSNGCENFKTGKECSSKTKWCTDLMCEYDEAKKDYYCMDLLREDGQSCTYHSRCKSQHCDARDKICRKGRGFAELCE